MSQYEPVSEPAQRERRFPAVIKAIEVAGGCLYISHDERAGITALSVVAGDDLAQVDLNAAQVDAVCAALIAEAAFSAAGETP